MDDFDIPIVWECIAQHKNIEKEDLEIETGVDLLGLSVVLQKLKYYDLIKINKEMPLTYIEFNQSLTTYQASRANNLGITMDLLDRYCVVDLKHDREILEFSLEFDSRDQKKKQRLKNIIEKQKHNDKIKKIEYTKKDLFDLLNITDEILKDIPVKEKDKKLTIDSINKQLNNILNKLVK